MRSILYLCRVNNKTTKVKKIFYIIFALIPLCSPAQKISLGSCITSDKGQYKGEMLAGKPHGKGSTIYDSGNIYDGEYIKGRKQGYGIFTTADGEKYDGEWMLDQKHGRGTLSCTIIMVMSMMATGI